LYLHLCTVFAYLQVGGSAATFRSDRLFDGDLVRVNHQVR
jgi:hypothetical protein